MSDFVEVLVSGTNFPVFAHPGDAGADLYSSESIIIPAGERRTVGTGLSLALPNGFVGFVVPRSGLAAKHGITIVNSPGTVDAGYRGEIRVTLLNTDQTQEFSIQPGDRIAQLIVMALVAPRFVEVETLPGTHRGEGGFGSTGVNDAQRKAQS